MKWTLLLLTPLAALAADHAAAQASDALPFRAPAGAAAGTPTACGQPGSPSPACGAASQAGPTDAELETFAAIYTELRAAARKFEQEVAVARTAEEARDARCNMTRAQQATLRAHGWTAAKFARIAAAVDSDPALVERTVELFDKAS